jgi:hypothetical protein
MWIRNDDEKRLLYQAFKCAVVIDVGTAKRVV